MEDGIESSPCIDGNNHGANRVTSPKREQPFGYVAHQEGDSVSFANSPSVEEVGVDLDLLVRLGIGDTLLFVDYVLASAEDLYNTEQRW